ncbi:MAG: FAD-dependent oxidoreductase [Candidatus Erginobacter occultus]|nr:FAD-dependent oxidoreductase [Candidatus Erginobacter occultus]
MGVILLIPALAAAAPTVWLEAEQFDDSGGWTNDAQFVDQMGSPYLLAIGLEGPAADAVTSVRIPAAGSYRLWVRALDWAPEHSPGRFQVVFNGRAAQHVFGRSKTGRWIWEDGGTHRLAGGTLQVRLRDLTGHYGRCDAVVLAGDPDWQPPEGLEAIAALREEFGGVSREPEVLEGYDTVVVGGGLAGTFAAVASARGGCRTALVQNRPVLGGNASPEILVEPQGDRSREPLDPGEGGIIEEVRGAGELYSDRLLALCRGEENLDLFLNTHATGVRKRNDRNIAALEALNVISGRRLVVPGRIFIDCTGDGQIGIRAGAEHRHGREPRSMYNETRAPEEGDRQTMGGTLRYATRETGEPVSFSAPAWARRFPECSSFTPLRHPRLHFGPWQWIIEYGGILDTYRAAEAIRDELLRIIWGMWDHVKNRCPRLSPKAENFQLAWVSHVVGQRESARLIGDYVMTEHDIARQIKHPDRVAYGGWGIDLHPPGGFYSAAPPTVFSHRQKYSIPFRSLYSKDLDNLMMAGRCISASSVALGATRVMITGGLQGQAVGTAAAISKERDCSPRGVYSGHIRELQQQLLKDGCSILELPNRDPRDLALGAAATASSVAPPVEIPPGPGPPPHSLSGYDRGVIFPVPAENLQTLSLYLASERETPIEVTLHVCRVARPGDFSAQSDPATATAVVPPGSEGWVEFAPDLSWKPGYYYAWIPRTAGLSWPLFAGDPADTSRAYRGQGDWVSQSGCYKFRLSETNADRDAERPLPRAAGRMFSAENAVNGFARAVDGWPNSWRPDPAQPLPQWIELDFGRERSFNTVHVSFQAQWMRAPAFAIQVGREGVWKTVARLTGNPARRRVLSFDRVTARKLRLVILEALPAMGVCEIRVYDEEKGSVISF